MTSTEHATTDRGLAVGAAGEDWTGDARYFEYTAAADPIRSGHTPVVPVRATPSALDALHPSGFEPFDLSTELRTDGPATSPGLLASFVHIAPDDDVRTTTVATSVLHVVLRGAGVSALATGEIAWGAGDVVAFPGGGAEIHRAAVDSEPVVIYRVTDEPLLRYLGATSVEARFRPTRWEARSIRRELDAVATDPAAADRNRVSVLLAGATQPQTLTATHVLWAMYGLLPVGAVQRPHRHQSVALDLIVDCAPGCHTLVGEEIDERGEIVDPQRVEWIPGGAFVTPPGLWHAHVNTSGAPAHLFPVQDAGLHTYLRSLDIRFVGA